GTLLRAPPTGQREDRDAEPEARAEGRLDARADALDDAASTADDARRAADGARGRVGGIARADPHLDELLLLHLDHAADRPRPPGRAAARPRPRAAGALVLPGRDEERDGRGRHLRAPVEPDLPIVAHVGAHLEEPGGMLDAIDPRVRLEGVRPRVLRLPRVAP